MFSFLFDKKRNLNTPLILKNKKYLQSFSFAIAKFRYFQAPRTKEVAVTMIYDIALLKDVKVLFIAKQQTKCLKVKCFFGKSLILTVPFFFQKLTTSHQMISPPIIFETSHPFIVDSTSSRDNPNLFKHASHFL